MSVHSTIYNIKQYLLKIIKYSNENMSFYFYWASKWKRKCVSWFWNFGNLALEKLSKIFGNIGEGVCTNLVTLILYVTFFPLLPLKTTLIVGEVHALIGKFHMHNEA